MEFLSQVLQIEACSTNKLTDDLKELMEICYQNLLHAQEL